jgi:adenylate kinase
MLRAAMEAGTDLGVRVKGIYDRGDLVPDDLMIDLIRERLEDESTEPGFVLDGFPRTPAQAEALDELLDEIGRELTIVLEFQAPDEVVLERLDGRAKTEGRSDDGRDIVRRRLQVYAEQTAPLVAYYRARGNLVGIHADRTVDEVFAEVQKVLEQAVAT